MLIVLVKHFLNLEGIRYFDEHWFPEAKKLISQQPGFISIESNHDAQDVSCMNVFLRFNDEESLENWIKTKAHGEIIHKLDQFRLRHWLVARVENNDNSKINVDEVTWRTANPNNIFSVLPKAPQQEEFFETLLQNKKIRIERIISKGQVTPEGRWYDQEEDEWVMLLKGSAVLLFENGAEVHLKSGDYFFIKAHQKHRVSWTDQEEVCIWLALHINNAG